MGTGQGPYQPGPLGQQPGAPGQQPGAPPPGGQPPAAPGAYQGGPPQQAAGPVPIKRSVVRVIGFTILSLGLYGFYWFYVTRTELKRELQTDDNPGLQTAGQLVPILNWVIIYWLWRDINAARRWVGLPEFSVPVYLVLSILGLSPIFYSLVVAKLNEYWDRRTGGYAVNAPITGGEIAVVVAGFLLGVLILVAIIAISVAAVSSGSGSSSFDY